MNQIDKMFKNKLGHYSVEVPDGAWANIAARLPEPKRSKRIWPGVIASIIGSAIVCISGYTILIPDSSSFATVNTNKPTSIASLHKTIDNSTNVKAVPPSNHFQLSANSDLKTNTYIAKTDLRTKSNISKSTTNQVKNLPVSEYVNENQLNIESINQYRTQKSIASLENRLEKNRLKSFKKIKFSSRYVKEKVKACPFVTDLQDKSADVYVSHDYALKSLTAKSQDLAGYAAMRNNTEKSAYSFSVGARFGFNLSYRWNLHTGFNYTQINEKFHYIDPESNQTRVITIKDYIYDNGKIIDSTITEEFVTVPGTTRLKINNRYRSFDIPVIGRYTLMANKHLSLSAMGGVYINIAITERGMILDKDSTTPIDIAASDDEGNTIIKTQMGITGYTGVSLAYHLTQNIDLLLEPNARFQFESMTAEKYPLDQRYTILGLSTGLRYKF